MRGMSVVLGLSRNRIRLPELVVSEGGDSDYARR